MIQKKSLYNWLCLFGPIACIFYFLHVYIGQSIYPDYNWMKQAVSDLTAVDSVSYKESSRLSSLYGFCSCLCCIAVTLTIIGNKNKQTRIGVYLYTLMNLISFIGYTLFPLSGSGYQGKFQDIMHLYVVTSLVVMLSIISLILIIIGGFKRNGNVVIAITGIMCLSSMFIGSIGMGIFSKEYFGLLERFSVFSVVLFTCILGIFGFTIKSIKTH